MLLSHLPRQQQKGGGAAAADDVQDQTHPKIATHVPISIQEFVFKAYSTGIVELNPYFSIMHRYEYFIHGIWQFFLKL
jgi:hypothetical protein